MRLLNFQDNPVWLNVLLFAGAACAIWYAGTRLERRADAIATRTGLGHAFIGVVLLATSTSLPEIATVTTAALAGNPTLAVHNLLGAVVFNMVVLAVADLLMGHKALSHESPKFVLLMQGLGLAFVLAVALMGMTVSRSLAGRLSPAGANVAAGAWGAVLLASYLAMLYVTYRGQKHPRWRAVRAGGPGGKGAEDRPPPDRPDGENAGGRPLSGLGLSFAAAALVVLLAGVAVARAGDALARQTGLGATFFGFTLMALSTTLPEMSSTVSAARAGRHETAFSNVFGSGAFNVMLLILVGLLSGGPAILQSVSDSAQFAAATGILLTCVYLWGLLEREDRTVLRMGWDSAAVVVFALAATWVMFLLG